MLAAYKTGKGCIWVVLYSFFIALLSCIFANEQMMESHY